MKVCIYCKKTPPSAGELDSFDLVILKHIYKLRSSFKGNIIPLRDFKIKANDSTENDLMAGKLFEKLVITGCSNSDKLLIATLRYQIRTKLVILFQSVNSFSAIKKSFPESSVFLQTDCENDRLAWDYVNSTTPAPEDLTGWNKIKIKALLLKVLLKKIYLAFTNFSEGEIRPFLLINFGERYDAPIRKTIGDVKIKIIDDIETFSFCSKNASILCYVGYGCLLKLLFKRNRIRLRFKKGNELRESHMLALENILNTKEIITHIYCQLIRINGIKRLEDRISKATILVNNCRGEYTFYLKKNRIMSHCLVAVSEIVLLGGNNIKVDKLFVHSKLEKETLIKEGVPENKIVPIGLMAKKARKLPGAPKRIVVFSISFAEGSDPCGGFDEEDLPMLQNNVEKLIASNPGFHFTIKRHPDSSGRNPLELLNGKYPNVDIVSDEDPHDLIQSSFFSINFLHSTVSFYSTIEKKISICVLSSKGYYYDPFNIRRFKSQIFLTDINKLPTCFSKVAGNQKLRDYLISNMDDFCGNYEDFDRDRFLKEIHGNQN